MTIQVKTFNSEKSCNEWLIAASIDNKKILKYYSNGPDYFFVVYER